MKSEKHTSFKDFYTFYLTEHQHKTNRLLHFCGTTLVIIIVINALATEEYVNLLYCPVVGYGLAWIGHYRFEKNKPASFKQPVYSLMADFVMWWQLLTKKIYF